MWTRLYQDQGKGEEERDRQACRRLARQGKRRASAGGMKEIRAHTGPGPKHAHMSM